MQKKQKKQATQHISGIIRNIIMHVPAIAELVLLYGNMRYVVLADVIQRLMCFDYWTSVSVRGEV